MHLNLLCYIYAAAQKYAGEGFIVKIHGCILGVPLKALSTLKISVERGSPYQRPIQTDLTLCVSKQPPPPLLPSSSWANVTRACSFLSKSVSFRASPFGWVRFIRDKRDKGKRRERKSQHGAGSADERPNKRTNEGLLQQSASITRAFYFRAAFLMPRNKLKVSDCA